MASDGIPETLVENAAEEGLKTGIGGASEEGLESGLVSNPTNSESVDNSADGPAQGFEAADAPDPANVTDFGAAPPEGSTAEGAAEPEKPRRDFYIIKVPRPDLSNIINSIKAAEQKLKEKKDKQQLINAALNLKKAARSEVLANLKGAREKSRASIREMQNKFEEIKPLQDAIRRFQDANSAVRNRTRELQCSSELELDQKLAEMDFKLQHESLTLTEEKKLIRDMKTLENSRAEIRENEALSNSVSESLTHKEAIQARLKPLLAEVDILKMEREAARTICDSFDAEYKALEKSVNDLFAERAKANQDQDDAYHALQKLRQECQLQEQEYRQNLHELAKFRQFGANNDVKGLEELCNEQVERIHSKLDSDHGYRKKFYKDMEFSLLRRFGSLDTRRLTLEEENALKQANETKSRNFVPSEPQKSTPKPVKETPIEVPSEIAASKSETETTRKPEQGKPSSSKEVTNKEASTPSNREDEISQEEKKRIKDEKLEEERKLKEKKREEELIKAREAEERKRRLREKAQKKAEIKAQKEAEELALKKEKEKEKKARKLAAKAEKEKEEKEKEEDKDENENGSGNENKTEEKNDDEEETSNNESNERESHLTKRQRKRISNEKSKLSSRPPLSSVLSKKKKTFWNQPVFLFSIAALLILAIVSIFLYTRTFGSSASFQ